MVTYHNGDLLKSHCHVIAHQCNLQSSFGGGIAAQIKKLCPFTEQMCQAKERKIGDVVMTFDDENSYIFANCFSQDNDYHTNYVALTECFVELLKWCQKYNCKTIGVPYNYGCGIATGNWEIVDTIFHEIFDESNVELQIWKL